MAPIPATGYWMFMANPAKWAIDLFLTDHNTPKDLLPVSETRQDQFKPGQFGIVRVGSDRRAKDKLGGRARLTPGIYALVEVLSAARPWSEFYQDKYWAQPDKQGSVVDVQYVKNLLTEPVALAALKAVPDIDPKLLSSTAEASYPLTKYAFELIAQLAGLDPSVWTKL